MLENRDCFINRKQNSRDRVCSEPNGLSNVASKTRPNRHMLVLNWENCRMKTETALARTYMGVYSVR